MKNFKTEHCRLLNEAKEQTRKAEKNVSAVGIVNSIGALLSAAGRGGDAHDWEADLGDILVEAVKALEKANDEIHKAIEIVMENEGSDNEKDN